MKLIVSQLGALSRYVSREFHYVMTDLINQYGWRHIDMWELFNAPGSFRDKLLNKVGELPSSILFWEGYELLPNYASDISRLDCHKIIFADDLHWWNERMRQGKLISFALCDTVLSPYGYLWPKFYPELAGAKRVVWIPHSASQDFMVDYNPHPDNSVFLSGAVSPHYPMRQQVKELHTERAYSIIHHEHPGYHCQYDYNRDQNVGRGYAEKINKYRTSFTDSLIYGYIVAKYFEIPATGSLLLADDAVSGPLKDLGFIENQHYLAVSKENLEEKIQYVLDEANHEELDEIRKVGQQLVWSRHKTSDRARSINEVCNGG
jgi:hypothetical protein